MAEHLHEKPVKSILKKHDSIDSSSSSGAPVHHNLASPGGTEHKEMKWDEMNILATHHPEGKDYGHMKIDEPKTPYNHYRDRTDSTSQDMDVDVSESGTSSGHELQKGQICPTDLADRLKDEQHGHPHKTVRAMSFSGSESDEDESEMTPEERQKRREFREHRKKHYNEYLMVRKAKELLHEEGLDAMDSPTGNTAVNAETPNAAQ